MNPLYDSATVFLAQAGGQAGADAFFDSEIGGSIGSILGALAVIIVLITIVVAIGPFSKGQIGKGIKIIVGGLILAALAWNPSLFTSAIGALSDIFGRLFSSFNQIAS